MESTRVHVHRWTFVSAVLNLWIPIAGDKLIGFSFPPSGLGYSDRCCSTTHPPPPHTHKLYERNISGHTQAIFIKFSPLHKSKVHVYTTYEDLQVFTMRYFEMNLRCT
jgi:hypothetical protein